MTEYCLQENIEWQKKEEVDEMITLKKEKVDNMVAWKKEKVENMVALKMEEKEADLDNPCNTSTPDRDMKLVSTASNFVLSSPPAFASSPFRPVINLLSRSASIRSSPEQEEHGGEGLGLSIWSRTEKTEQEDHGGPGLGLSILREGGEGTLTDRILAALVDCCFCA